MELQGRKYTDERLRAMALEKVKSLSLWDTAVTSKGVEELRRASELVQLDIRASGLGDEVLRIAAGLTELKSLLLRGIKITDEGARELKRIPQLRELYLANSLITDRGLEGIRGFSELWSLVLSGTRISDAAFDVLCTLPNLRVLMVGRTRVTGSGLHLLKKTCPDIYANGTEVSSENLSLACRSLPRMRLLDVSDTAVADEGLGSISCCIALEDLRLSATGVTPTVLGTLAGLPALGMLYLERTLIKQEHLEKVHWKSDRVRVVFSDRIVTLRAGKIA